WLKTNALVISIGAVGPTVRELDDEVMRTCYILAESRAGVELESGDLRLSGAKVAAEIGGILTGSGTSNIPRDRRVLFKVARDGDRGPHGGPAGLAGKLLEIEVKCAALNFSSDHFASCNHIPQST